MAASLQFQFKVWRESGMWLAQSQAPFEHTAQGDTMPQALEDCLTGLLADWAYANEHDTIEFLRLTKKAQQQLEAIEDEMDVEEAERVLADIKSGKEKVIPARDVYRDLGLTWEHD